MNDHMKQCEICGQWFSIKGIGTHKWRMHGEGINFNPNRGYVKGTRKAWNKGLTKETNDSVKRSSQALMRIKTPLENELDDDGKLMRRWRNKCVNALAEGIKCELSFDQYCQLVKEAGLKSSQLGFTGEGYVLARYNDAGNYTIHNCRFITQKENSDEKNSRIFGVKNKRKFFLSAFVEYYSKS